MLQKASETCQCEWNTPKPAELGSDILSTRGAALGDEVTEETSVRDADWKNMC